MSSWKTILLRVCLLLGLAVLPNSAWACAACYGQSDSPLARGMNWGILSLLAVVVVVLGGIATFFVCLARRSAAAVEPSRPPLLKTMQES